MAPLTGQTNTSVADRRLVFTQGLNIFQASTKVACCLIDSGKLCQSSAEEIVGWVAVNFHPGALE